MTMRHRQFTWINFVSIIGLLGVVLFLLCTARNIITNVAPETGTYTGWELYKHRKFGGAQIIVDTQYMTNLIIIPKVNKGSVYEKLCDELYFTIDELADMQFSVITEEIDGKTICTVTAPLKHEIGRSVVKGDGLDTYNGYAVVFTTGASGSLLPNVEMNCFITYNAPGVSRLEQIRTVSVTDEEYYMFEVRDIETRRLVAYRAIAPGSQELEQFNIDEEEEV